MADYYSLLNNTIGKLANNTADNRAIVYGKARAAIDRKLRAMEPVPSEEAIARQMQLLEDAIERMEADHGGMGAMPQAAAEPAAVSPAPHVPPAPAAEEPAYDAADTAPAHNAAYSGHQVSDGNEAVHRSYGDEQDFHAGSPTGSAQEDSYSADFSSRGSDRDGVSAHLDTHPGDATDRHDIMFDAPASAPAHVSADEADLAPPEMPVFQPQRKKKKGAFGKILTFLIGIGVIAGGGYFVWSNYNGDLTKMADSMTESLTGGGDKADSDTTADNAAQDGGATEATSEETAGEKENARLDSEGQTTEGDPVVANETSEPVDEQAPVILDQPNTTEGNTTEADAGAGDGAGTDGQQQVAAANSATPAVADRAFLYTEATGGQGANLSNANVVWKLDGTQDDPVIHGEMDVPNLGMVMLLDIKRNEDASLSASHLIDLRFQVPSDFEGRNVDNVARFVMKDSEQAVGDPLIGVPAKILDGNFIIALDNLDKAKEVNKALMLNSGWIDIPLIYSTGVRALVTLEKGAQGDEVFKKAFAAWDKK